MRKIVLLLLVFYSLSLFGQKEGNFQILTGGETDFFFLPYKRDLIILNSGFGYKGNLTAIYGKVNLGYTHKTIDNELLKEVNNVQLELDYWQSFSKSKSTSIWFNYAYGIDKIFPQHRIVLWGWQKLFAGFLVSGGVNHYQFTDSHATFLNTGLENYFGRHWLEGKVYFYLKVPKGQKKINNIMRTSAPDIDNLLKAILDSIFKGLSIKDSRIVMVQTAKFQVLDNPRTEITLRSVDDGN